MAALNDEEKAKILRYLGYVDWKDLALSKDWDVPYTIPPEYWINDAFSRVSDQGLELVRRDLRELECVEAQISDCRRRLKASKIGNITLNQDEFKALKQHMDYWTKRLADDFGSNVAPHSHQVGLAGGRNAKVYNG